MKRAVIFDFDGVIANSLPVHFKKHQFVAKKVLGYDLTKEYFFDKCNGRISNEFYQVIIKENGYDPTLLSKLVAENKRYNKTNFLDKVKTFPHVKTTLNKLRKEGFKIAVASSSPRSMVLRVMKLNGIEKKFDYIITGDQVTKTKPNPEIFLLAQKKLGFPKSQCVVIEDALNGFKAAKAAKIDVIGLPTSVPKKVFPKYVHYVKEHKTLYKKILEFK